MVEACRAMVLLDCWQTWQEVRGQKGDREIKSLKVDLMNTLRKEGFGEEVRWTVLGSQFYSVHVFEVEGERFIWWLKESQIATTMDRGELIEKDVERPSGWLNNRLNYPPLSETEVHALKGAVKKEARKNG